MYEVPPKDDSQGPGATRDGGALPSRSQVLVLGGGPAGSAAALTLARVGVSVTLVERAGGANWKAGECLPPAANSLLKRLGVWARFLADRHTPSYGTRSAWGTRELADVDFIYGLGGVGWHLDRGRFDEMMIAAAAEAGAARRRVPRAAAVRRDGSAGWVVESGARGPRLHAQFLIDASGRSGWLARRQGVGRKSYDSLIGIVGLFDPSGRDAARDSRTLIEAAADGWWYSALLPGGRLLAAYMTDVDLPGAADARGERGWLRLLARTHHTRARVEAHGAGRPQFLRPAAANSTRLESAAGGSWVAVGDAAAAHDPLSSQGITAALLTGQRAGAALVARLGGDPAALTRYAEGVAADYEDYLTQRAAYYGMERRWQGSPFWSRRHRAAAAPLQVETEEIRS